MNFVKVNPGDEDLIQAVYEIIKNSGQYMIQEFGLYHWERPYPIESIKNDLEEKVVYVVEEDGEYLATFSYTEKTSYYFEDIPDKRAVYVSKFAVNPMVVQRGIGTKCLQFLENELLKVEKSIIRLDVYDKSQQAISFYHKNGFVDLYKRPTRRFEVICMQKVFE